MFTRIKYKVESDGLQFIEVTTNDGEYRVYSDGEVHVRGSFAFTDLDTYRAVCQELLQSLDGTLEREHGAYITLNNTDITQYGRNHKSYRFNFAESCLNTENVDKTVLEAYLRKAEIINEKTKAYLLSEEEDLAVEFDGDNL